MPDVPDDLCHRCWEPDCPGTCGYPVKEPDEEPLPDLKHFPYHDIYKVRNMYFAMDIPVFTSREDQDVKDGYYTFKHIYCCN